MFHNNIILLLHYQRCLYISYADVGECLLGIHNCSQVCVELLGNFECSCYHGYMLQDDGVTCEGLIQLLVLHTAVLLVITDIDECSQGLARCNHGCRNTVGSFICTCHVGYHLHHDSPLLCVGMFYCYKTHSS